MAEERDRHEVVAVLAHEPADPAAFAAEHERDRLLAGPPASQRSVPAASKPTTQTPRAFRASSAWTTLPIAGDPHVLEGPRRGAVDGLGQAGAVPLGQQHAVGPRRFRGAQDRAQVARVLDAVEHDEQAPGRAPVWSSAVEGHDRLGGDDRDEALVGHAARHAVEGLAGLEAQGDAEPAGPRDGFGDAAVAQSLHDQQRGRSAGCPAASASRTGLMPQMRFMRLRESSLEQRPSPGPRCLRRGPIAPSPSVLLTLTETASRSMPSRRASASRISPRCGARAGACAITVTSTFSIAARRARPPDAGRARGRRRLSVALPARVAAREVLTHVPGGRGAEQGVADARGRRSRRRSGPRGRDRSGRGPRPAGAGGPRPGGERRSRCPRGSGSCPNRARRDALGPGQVFGGGDLAVAGRARHRGDPDRPGAPPPSPRRSG